MVINIDKLINGNSELGLLLKGMPSHIFNQMYLKRFSKNDIILKKGQVIRDVYIQVVGTTNVYNEFASGHIYVFASSDPVDFVAGVAPLAGEKHASVTVTAAEDSVFLGMHREYFIEWLRIDNYASFFLLQKYAQRQYPNSSQRGRNYFISSNQKVAEYIYLKVLESEDEKTKISKTREVLADEIGISVRSVNRNIKILNLEGLISIEKGKIFVSTEQMNLLSDYIVKVTI